MEVLLQQSIPEQADYNSLDTDQPPDCNSQLKASRLQTVPGILAEVRIKQEHKGFISESHFSPFPHGFHFLTSERTFHSTWLNYSTAQTVHHKLLLASVFRFPGEILVLCTQQPE
jgi:hypothetical protein